MLDLLTSVLDLLGLLLLLLALVLLVSAVSVHAAVATGGLGLLAVSWLIDRRGKR